MFEGKLYELNSDKPFSGMVFNTYPSGSREYEGDYKNVEQHFNLAIVSDSAKAHMLEERGKELNERSRQSSFSNLIIISNTSRLSVFF